MLWILLFRLLDLSLRVPALKGALTAATDHAHALKGSLTDLDPISFACRAPALRCSLMVSTAYPGVRAPILMGSLTDFDPVSPACRAPTLKGVSPSLRGNRRAPALRGVWARAPALRGSLTDLDLVPPAGPLGT